MKKTILFLIIFLFILSICFVVSADIKYLNYLDEDGVFGNAYRFPLVNDSDHSDIFTINSDFASEGGLYKYTFNGDGFSYVAKNGTYNEAGWTGVYNNSYIFYPEDDEGIVVYQWMDSLNNFSFIDKDIPVDFGNNAMSVSTNGEYFILAGDDHLYFYQFIDDKLILKGNTTQIEDCFMVYWDGTYFYAKNEGGDEEYLYAFTFNENGTNEVWIKAYYDPEITDTFYSIDGDGSYIFASYADGLSVFSFDGNSFTHIDTYSKDNLNVGSFRGCTFDDNYIYVGTLDALVIFSFDGTNIIFEEYERNRNSHIIFYNAVFDNYIVSSCYQYGISSFYHLKPRDSKPTNIQTSKEDANSINVSWSKASDCNYTLLVKQVGSYPSSPTDGTVVYNGTNSYAHIDISDLSNSYFRLWGLEDYTINSTTLWQSTNNYSDITFGGVLINAVDVNTTNNISFNIFISNTDGTQIYVNNSDFYYYFINSTEIPTGNDISFTFTKDGYKNIVYYLDIASDSFYSITGYMTDENVSNLYYYQVLDEYNSPLSDVKLNIKRYVNETLGFKNVTIVYTDGYGYANLYLEPDIKYKVIAYKEGYVENIIEYIPDASYYGYYYPKIIKLTTSFEEPSVYSFNDVITFTATMYLNYSIHVTYEDVLTNTTNAQFYTYQIFNSTKYLNATNTTTDDSFSFWVENIDISRQHTIIMHLNHTNLGYETKSIILLPLTVAVHDDATIVDRFIAVFGSFDLNIFYFFIVYIPCIALLVLPGPKHPGLGAICSGLWVGFINIRFSIPLELNALVPFIIIIGVILMIYKEGDFKI